MEGLGWALRSRLRWWWVSTTLFFTPRRALGPLPLLDPDFISTKSGSLDSFQRPSRSYCAGTNLDSPRSPAHPISRPSLPSSLFFCPEGSYEHIPIPLLVQAEAWEWV